MFGVDRRMFSPKFFNSVPERAGNGVSEFRASILQFLQFNHVLRIVFALG
jgi:hypothetical protein